MSIMEYPPITTVTIGIKTKDSVILASEKIYAYDNYIISKNVKKIYSITNYLGIAFAGVIGDIEVLTNYYKSRLALYELETRHKISVKAAAKLLSKIFYGHRYIPFLTQSIIGGVDEEGPQLYSLDILGSVITDNILSVGLGSNFALGVLESSYSEDISTDEAVSLAVSAIKAATKRTAGTGRGIDLLAISPKGSQEKYFEL